MILQHGVTYKAAWKKQAKNICVETERNGTGKSTENQHISYAHTWDEVKKTVRLSDLY